MNRSKAQLGERLRKLRIAKGYASARKFAKALGVSENRYSRYERGETAPKLELLPAICALLSVTPTELYGGDGVVPDLADPPATGLAEPAVSFIGANPPAANGVDASAWRLAAAMTAAKRAGTDSGRAPDLGAIRETGEIYLQLRQDPYAVIARCLQSVVPDRLPPDQATAMAHEIETFLAAIETVQTDRNAGG